MLRHFHVTTQTESLFVSVFFFSDFSILVWVYFYTYYFHSFSFLNFYSWEDHCFLRAKNSAATHSFSLFVDD